MISFKSTLSLLLKLTRGKCINIICEFLSAEENFELTKISGSIYELHTTNILKWCPVVTEQQLLTKK